MSTRPFRRILVFVLLAVVFASCEPGGKSFESTRKLMAALEDEGLAINCDVGTNNCDIAESGEFIVLSAFDDSARDGYVETLESSGVQALVGPNWSIVSHDRDFLLEVSETLGGELFP